MKHFKFMPLLLTMLFAASSNAADLVASPPPQPDSGPGGADYKFDAIRKSTHGWGPKHVTIFEPADVKTTKPLPVIVFNHGYLATSPSVYGGWIEHIVRRGNIVIFPRYQVIGTKPAQITDNAITGLQTALKQLKDKADLTKFAIVGHSAGGIISANMAALAEKRGLPKPKAVMLTCPGISRMFGLENLLNIPKDCLLLTVVTEHDIITGNSDAKRIFHMTKQISLANKDYIKVRTVRHGARVLTADHNTPCSFQSIVGATDKPRSSMMKSSLDYYAFWKLLDGLTDAAFYNKNRKFALGNTPEQRFMGKWSDGTPVTELVVTDKP